VRAPQQAAGDVVTEPTISARAEPDRDVQAVLLLIPVALQKTAAYPPGHPLAAGAVSALATRLSGLLAARGTLSVGVARTHLLIDGVPTDPGQPVLRDLAERLHRRAIAGLTFSDGVTADELEELLRHLSIDRTRERDDGEAETEAGRWPHVRVHAAAFDQLRLADGEAGTVAEEQGAKLARLWTALSLAAMGGGARSAEGEPLSEPAAIARAIEAGPRDRGYEQAVARQLLELGRASALGGSVASLAISEQLEQLMLNLRPETLLRLLNCMPDPGERRELLSGVSHAAPAAAIIELVKSASQATGNVMSESLLRMLTKLARNADAAPDHALAEADDALREIVTELLDGWMLQDPNPEAYGAALERLARRPNAGMPGSAGALEAEPTRIVTMALELGAPTDDLGSALDAMLARDALPALLTWLGAAEPANRAAAEVWRLLTRPERLGLLLSRPDAGGDVMDQLLARAGTDAAGPLLDLLATTEVRATRRRLITWLTQLGPTIAPDIVARLSSPQWYVQRNMLVLLASLPELPAGLDLLPYLSHGDARVRREAMKLALRDPARRDEAITLGLADGDPQVLQFALAAAGDRCPSRGVGALIDQLERRQLDPELRAQMIRVLSGSRLPRARDWLLRRALVRRPWLPGRRLAPRSPELLAVLGGLAAFWADDRIAAAALRLAAASRDADVRAAATGPVP
jgi:hypothetical protein